jgi:hypothetical protein
LPGRLERLRRGLFLFGCFVPGRFATLEIFAVLRRFCGLNGERASVVQRDAAG